MGPIALWFRAFMLAERGRRSNWKEQTKNEEILNKTGRLTSLSGVGGRKPAGNFLMHCAIIFIPKLWRFEAKERISHESCCSLWYKIVFLSNWYIILDIPCLILAACSSILESDEKKRRIVLLHSGCRNHISIDSFLGTHFSRHKQTSFLFKTFIVSLGH